MKVKVTVKEPLSRNAKAFGSRLQAIRVGHGLRLEDVACMADCTRAAVSWWEQGKGIPSATNLLALAELFDNTTMAELVKDTIYEKILNFDREHGREVPLNGCGRIDDH